MALPTQHGGTFRQLIGKSAIASPLSITAARFGAAKRRLTARRTFDARRRRVSETRRGKRRSLAPLIQPARPLCRAKFFGIIKSRKGDTMKTYRLGSNEMICAPGLIAWAINGASFKRDRPAMVRVVSQGWGIPQDAARKLVTKQVPYTIEDETVVFTA
jgi:hypothetical protein